MRIRIQRVARRPDGERRMLVKHILFVDVDFRTMYPPVGPMTIAGVTSGKLWPFPERVLNAYWM